jgi:hypothetical protein
MFAWITPVDLTFTMIGSDVPRFVRSTHTTLWLRNISHAVCPTSELAVEQGELDTFLRRNEDYKPFVGDAPMLPQQPIGVPGVATPLQMTPERLKKHVLATPASSPMKGKIVPANKRMNELDMGVELSGYGLQGVKVTKDELNELLEELEHELKHGLNLKKGGAEKGPGTVVQTKDEEFKGKVPKEDPETSKVVAADEDEKSKDSNIKEESKEQKPVEADEQNPFSS